MHETRTQPCLPVSVIKEAVHTPRVIFVQATALTPQNDKERQGRRDAEHEHCYNAQGEEQRGVRVGIAALLHVHRPVARAPRRLCVWMGQCVGLLFHKRERQRTTCVICTEEEYRSAVNVCSHNSCCTMDTGSRSPSGPRGRALSRRPECGMRIWTARPAPAPGTE